ncbi:hapless 8 [Raphanus sativus]|nr:hapless 8 [Raphanus sativus]
MFFLSTENPPHDHHPLPSISLHLTSSSSYSHELAQSHPQSFSIRDYAYSNRKKNKIENNWPFSPKSLKLVSTHGVTDPLPPFDEITSGKQIVSHVQRGRDLAKLGLTHQTIAKTRKGVCSQTRTVENGCTSVSKSTKEEIVLVAATTGNKHSKTCGRGGGGMVKSKEATSCDVGLESIIMASSKTCPICKTFSSASNTTLNAHIDQCISVDSSPVISKPNKTRGKPRMKVRTMVDIYASAKRCTLEDLDKRNGTKWAVISSYSDRVVADKSDVSKKRRVPPVGVGPVYVDAKGQKLRILTEFSEKKTSTATLMREQRDGDGSSSKGHRRIFNQRMLAKRGSSSKKLNEKGDKKQKLRSEVSGRSKTMSGSKRSQRVRMSEKEEKSLAGGAHINTVRLKRSLTSIQEDKYPPRKNVREVTDASPRSTSMRKLLPPFVTNGWRRLSLPVELKRARLDLSEEEEEETGRWESEMTLSDDNYVSEEERNKVLHRSNPSTFSGYDDYDDEESSEEEEDNSEGANVLDKRDETGAEFHQSNATIPSERAMYYSEEAENMVYEEEEVRFDSEVGKGSLYVEVDNIPIPGPPGSFIPSPRGGMSYDEHLGNSSVITSQLQSSMDHLDRNSSESPVSAFSNFAAGRLSFPPELSSSLRDVLSVGVPSPYSTTPVSFSVPSHPEKMTVDKTTTPWSFRNNDHESCCCQRKERISEGVTLNHQPSQLLQRRASASSSMAMNLTKPPTRLDPNHPFEQSPYMIQQEFDLHSKFFNKANVNGAVVPPSPSNSVLRLMGKDLMVVMNQGEANNEEASRASLTPTPQFLDTPPCAGTGLYLNTGLYLRNSLEPTTHQPQTPASASAFRNSFDHVRYFSPS